ncbi:hypothetical protein BU23DRAFT_561295 [Bimuria novae-zelandiae CBS 107.79]|uniref:EH domain-containing protein n=1 Tax=Bimuria novae-zelandiae CBS 107.79 TaxID=1447943 RepID=A0A6A5UKD2_9PLEO|nr:hypothetical protein BU23DRAFT_561295 [Bimuria novae-zelandiae CBS 107.79]
MNQSSARNTPLAPQATGDTIHNVRDAALRGASTAFSRPPVKPKLQANTYTGGGNGALLAATKVGTGGTPRNPAPSGTATPLRRDWTGGSSRSVARPHASPMQPLSKSSSSSTLAVPDEGFAEPITSPSSIAAKLAAARYSPMKVKPLPQATSTPIMHHQEANERDVLPPPGSVGNVLAKLDSRHQNKVQAQRREDTNPDPVAIARAQHASLDRPTDDTPIPPTSSLVSIFEQTRPIPPKSPTPVRSPKPQRIVRLPLEPKDGEPLERQRTKTPPSVKPKPKPLSDPPQSTDGTVENTRFKNMRKDTFGSPPSVRKPPESVAARPTIDRPKPPPKMGSHSRPKSEDIPRPTSRHNRRLSSSLSHHESPSSPSSFVSARETQPEKPKSKPTLPPPRRSAKPAQDTRQTQSGSSTTTPLPIPSPTRAHAQSKPSSPPPPPTRFTPPRRASVSGASTPIGTVYHSNYQRESAKAITKHMTGESLSSAIMGAALASSRNASPARPSPVHLSPGPALTGTPPLPARKHYFSHSPFGRSPSPPKPKPPATGKLRTTMRKDPSSSDDEEEDEKYRRKGTRIMGVGRKHPNKHHEGTRKRWRDQITERERKRYEGVWAANKGLCIPLAPSPAGSRASSTSGAAPTRPNDDPTLDVVNLVTKEIWARSRLPDHVLEEVWDLVDSRGVSRLKREEFVVGMWLIDQRLKGRKLPIKVSESVWGSVRGATGVKVKVGDRHSHKPHKAVVKKPLV